MFFIDSLRKDAMGKPFPDSSVELCIELIGCQKLLNDGGAHLMKPIINDIKFAFGPEGFVARAQN